MESWKTFSSYSIEAFRCVSNSRPTSQQIPTLTHPRSQVWPVTMLQDLVNPRRDRRFWWREHDRALAAHFFWSQCRACLRFWRQGWIAHLFDDDYLVKMTLRFLWSRICRDSIFNVLSTKSYPVGRLWWLERLNTCQSSLYLCMNFEPCPKNLAQNVMLRLMEQLSAFLDQSCGEKTWRTRSSGWGVQDEGINLNWSAFPLSNKAAFPGFCPSNLMSLFGYFGDHSHDSHGLSSSGRTGECILPSWNMCTKYFSMSILRSFSHWRWFNFILQVFKYSVGWLHLSIY